MQGAELKVRTTFEFDLGDENLAYRVFHATKIDNGRFIEVHLKGSTLQGHVPEGEVGSIKATLDDFLGCLSMALKAEEITEGGK